MQQGTLSVRARALVKGATGFIISDHGVAGRTLMVWCVSAVVICVRRDGVCSPSRCVFAAMEWPTSERSVFTRQEGWPARPSHEIVFVLVNVQANVLVRLLLFVDLQQLIAALRLFPCTLLRQGALLLLPFPRRLDGERGAHGNVTRGIHRGGHGPYTENHTRQAADSHTLKQRRASVVRT